MSLVTSSSTINLRGRRREETPIKFPGDGVEESLILSPIMVSQPRSYYLPRLEPEFYQGDAVIHWTLAAFNRGTGWLNAAFHARFREIMLHAAAREGLYCPVYCLMPDHLHLMWMGLRRDSDQKNGMSFLRTHLARGLLPHRFQPQSHDHVLREAERKTECLRENLFLHPGESGSGRIDKRFGSLAVLRCRGAGLSQAGSAR